MTAVSEYTIYRNEDGVRVVWWDGDQPRAGVELSLDSARRFFRDGVRATAPERRTRWSAIRGMWRRGL